MRARVSDFPSRARERGGQTKIGGGGGEEKFEGENRGRGRARAPTALSPRTLALEYFFTILWPKHSLGALCRKAWVLYGFARPTRRSVPEFYDGRVGGEGRGIYDKKKKETRTNIDKASRSREYNLLVRRDRLMIVLAISYAAAD